MVSQKDKQQATKFICDRLEGSGLYVIQQRTDRVVEVREKPEVETPGTFKVVIANFFSAEEFELSLGYHRTQGIYIAPVLYKDGKTAFVRMVDRNISWRSDKSLKRYLPQQINQMLHLRKIEKVILEQFGQTLRYYQPKTENLEESIRSFQMGSVHLDYGHIGPGDPGYGFVHDRKSIDYTLPVNVETITGAVRLRLFSQPDSYRRARIVSI